MPTYLFVTKPEYTPERVESGDDLWWSCSSTTQRGDQALVYVAGAGIQYEWRVLSDAKKNDEWRYICDVEHVRTLVHPITIREIRERFRDRTGRLRIRIFEDYVRSLCQTG